MYQFTADPPTDDEYPDDDPEDELDPPLEPAQIADMFPDRYVDPDEDA